jgi:hypothetical protein
MNTIGSTISEIWENLGGKQSWQRPYTQTLTQQLHRFYFTSTEEFNEQLSQARYEEVEIE